VFSGDAYATNFVENIPGNPPGTVIFDNIALTVLSGTTLNLILTADTPLAGTGTYTASLDPTATIAGDPAVDARGKFWGDIVTLSAATITGGTLSTDPLTLSSLEQTRFTGGATIPTGGSTPENQVVLKGIVTTPSGGTVGM